MLIKRRRETAHRNVMLAAFGVSTVFLASYLIYHFGVRAPRQKILANPPLSYRLFHVY